MMRQKHVILLKKEHLIFKNAVSIECPGRLLLESTSKNFIGEKEIFDKKTTAKQFNEYFVDTGHNIQDHRDISSENFIKYEGPDLEITELADAELPEAALRKRCSENMQQTYRRTPIPKCDFNKVACKSSRYDIS